MHEDIEIEVDRSPAQETSPSQETAWPSDWRRTAIALSAVVLAICAVFVTWAEMQQADAAGELACLQRAQAESIVIGPGSMQMGTEDYKNRVAEC